MEDDIRDLVHGTSPPRPDAKSLKSRSKSTTAKSTKKKKKSTDSKSKSKSTTTGKKKKREKSAPPVPDPATLTIQVPPVPPVAVSLPLATGTASPLSVPRPPPQSSVSEHLREIINDSTIPAATPTPSTRADTHVDSSKPKDKASKPRKKKESSKRKEQQTQNQAQEQQQQEEEGEEKRKRRERLMVSPFEYLHITPFRHGEEDFHDDISFLTLPKQLRDQEGQSVGNSFSLEEENHHEHHLSLLEEEQITPQPEVSTDNVASNQFNNDTKPNAPAGDIPSTEDQQQPLPAPGWARKSKPERTARTKEQASTDLSHLPEISSLPSAHSHFPSPSFSRMTTHLGYPPTTATAQLETRNEKNESLPKNLLPQKKPQMEETKTIQVMTPQTKHPTLDRTRSWSHVEAPSSKAPPAPHLAQASPSLSTQETPVEKEEHSWLLLTRWRRQVTIEKATIGIPPNCDVESGNQTQPAQMMGYENKSPLEHHSRKHPRWCMTIAVVSFFCLVLLTIILVVILAKGRR